MGTWWAGTWDELGWRGPWDHPDASGHCDSLAVRQCVVFVSVGEAHPLTINGPLPQAGRDMA